MRLLNTLTRKLTEFASNKVPLYGILSHTWEVNEVNFQEMQTGYAKEFKGYEYEKIDRTCSIAAAEGLKYVWIDSCCIDRSSSAELSEAINSMYRWYQQSAVCYAYLADVPSIGNGAQPLSSSHIGFSESRYWTRGFTLQEVIAPSAVVFLNQDWKPLGSKFSLQRRISMFTKIPRDVLLKGDVGSASIAQRMSWASSRQTTREEDSAYCLMGLFDINMPLLYGEGGEKAFIRLQEEIMKTSDDHSLFAWESKHATGGLLASSPAMFSEAGSTVKADRAIVASGPIMLNNKGIHLELPVRWEPHLRHNTLAVLPCTNNGDLVALPVRKVSSAGDNYERIPGAPNEPFGTKEALNPKHWEGTSLPFLVPTPLCFPRRVQITQHEPRLSAAVAQGNLVLVNAILERDETLLNSKDERGCPLLWIAAEHGHAAVAKLLIDQGAPLEFADDEASKTPLWTAAAKGHFLIIQLLADAGARLNPGDLEGRTPLCVAAENGNEELVILLLRLGADTHSEDQWGQSPMSRARRKGHKKVVELLREHNMVAKKAWLDKASNS